MRTKFDDRRCSPAADAGLTALREDERRSVRIVDAGCGDGTWLIWAAMRARTLGFTAIEAHGVDVSASGIARARAKAGAVRDLAIGLTFAVDDLPAALAAEGEEPADLVLCLGDAFDAVTADRRPALARTLAGAGEAVLLAALPSRRRGRALREIGALLAEGGRLVERVRLGVSQTVRAYRAPVLLHLRPAH